MAYVLYIAAAIAWVLLLFPYPVTVFMATCVSCAFFPLFRRIQQRIDGWRGVAVYGGMLACMMTLPIAILVLLVIPQATAGYNMLKTLREANFQLPPAWMEQWQTIKAKLDFIPGLQATLDEFVNNLDTFLANSVSTIVSGSMSFVGGTFTVLWEVFLFFTLTILCTLYAQRLYSLTLALTRMPAVMLERFITAVRGALRGVLLGVVLVAIAQGVLCGIGFAVAGVKQPAFWGMLATLVAPIPLVGTALVWLPLCLMLWFTDNTFAAVGLFLWGTIAVAGADNFLRPLFLRQGINAPIFVLVLAILCGMSTFGPVGLIAGPVLVAFAVQAIREADILQGIEK